MVYRGEQFPAVTLPVTAGMRDDIEPMAAPVGTITRALNVRFPREGGIQSRWGVHQLNVQGDMAAGYQHNNQGPDFVHPARGGFVFGAQGFGFRHDRLLDRGQAAGSYSRCQPRGKFDVSTREELTPISQTVTTPWPLSQAVTATLAATCHAVGNGQPGVLGAFIGQQRDNASVIVVTAGAVVRVFTHEGVPVASHYFEDATSAMVISDPMRSAGAGQLYVVYQVGTSLRVQRIGLDGQAQSPGVIIGALATDTSFYAACPWPGQGWAVVWQSAAGSLTVQKMADVAIVGAPQIIAITAGPSAPVSIYADATNLWVGWALRGGASWDAQGRVCDTAFGSVAAFNVMIESAATPVLGPPLYGPCATPGTVLALVGRAAQSIPAIGGMSTHAARITTAGAVTMAAPGINSTLFPLSPPFANGLWWARHATRTPNGIQTMRAVLLDFYETRATIPAGAFPIPHPKLAAIGDQTTFAEFTTLPACLYLQHQHQPVQLSNGEWISGIPRVVRQELGQGGNQQYLPICEWLRFAIGCEQQVRTVGEDVLASGSLVAVNASPGSFKFSAEKQLPSSGFDTGLIQMPGIASLTRAVGGSLTPLGTYQYRAVIEVIDARGRRWRSAPSSIAKTTLLAGENQISVMVNAWVPILRAFSVSPAVSRIMVHIYRTPAGGFNFQRVTPPMGGPVPHLAGEYMFVDSLSDTLLAQREFLYTDGGVLQNDHPPSCRFIADTEDRVWLGGLWDSNLIQSSKTIVPGEGVAFSDLDAFKLDLKEPCTGLAAQDGTLFAFTASRVYAIQGLGPNGQGQGAWDDAKRELSRSTGCIDWRSIVETTAGVVYQSKRGIMLVPRGGGEPQFVGAPVQKLLAELGGEITGAAVCQDIDGHTVRFCCPGGMLILDLGTMAWSYDVPNDAPIPVSITRYSKVCDAEGGPILARKISFFDQEVRGQTFDDWGPFGSAQIGSFVSWAPVRPGGLAGWGTFMSAIGVFGKLDGQPYPATALTFSAIVDNDASCTATRATMADFQPLADFRRLGLRSRQGCSASLSFETAGAPWRFVGWTIETEDLDGPRRTPPAEYI